MGVRGLVSGLGGGGRRWMGGQPFHNFVTDSQNATMTYFQRGIYQRGYDRCIHFPNTITNPKTIGNRVCYGAVEFDG